MPMTNKKDPAARCRKLADKDSVVLARLEQTRLVPYARLPSHDRPPLTHVPGR